MMKMLKSVMFFRPARRANTSVFVICVKTITIRQKVSDLTRRTWGPAVYASELEEHLEWWRSYYHYVRYHESLKVKLAQPDARKGNRQAVRYRHRTPAMAAGLTDRRWTVMELLSIPLP